MLSNRFRFVLSLLLGNTRAPASGLHDGADAFDNVQRWNWDYGRRVWSGKLSRPLPAPYRRRMQTTDASQKHLNEARAFCSLDHALRQLNDGQSVRAAAKEYVLEVQAVGMSRVAQFSRSLTPSDAAVGDPRPPRRSLGTGIVGARE